MIQDLYARAVQIEAELGWKVERPSAFEVERPSGSIVMVYAAVVYISEETPDAKYSEFIVSKTRGSPRKTQTIPRLELLSTLLLARHITNVMDSLKHRLCLQEPRCFYRFSSGTILDHRNRSGVETIHTKQSGRNSKTSSHYVLGPLCGQRQPCRHTFTRPPRWENFCEQTLEESCQLLRDDGPICTHFGIWWGPGILHSWDECCRSKRHTQSTELACVRNVIHCEHYNTVHKLYRVTDWTDQIGLAT